eukprot:3269175-Heterocapsa_arctica.AAC.1
MELDVRVDTREALGVDKLRDVERSGVDKFYLSNPRYDVKEAASTLLYETIKMHVLEATSSKTWR